ncbi:TNF receptor-associated factor 4-like isoform X2 [Oopsacas minuta]|uniref:TNF receptor-associated factor 4-like isoform X2 n=1 Tax=Oopsacas minuta TaxID=111878 RepID=A0AAV7K3B4_9METZ|nr:TNF receptor-associated factor 4-like isoform X2 [Oopsacas minuta]
MLSGADLTTEEHLVFHLLLYLCFKMVPDNSNDFLYIKKVKETQDLYYGYNREYLAQNLTEMEEEFIVCKKCTGIMREASICRGDITCLICSETPDKLNPVKAVQSSISKLVIKCPLLRDCHWKGQLSEAEEHMENCIHILIQCKYCKEIFARKESDEHNVNICPMRLINCRNCNKRGKAEHLEEHYEVCLHLSISCPNNCGGKLLRSELSIHKRKCELETISCPYTEYGCETGLMMRKDLIAHKKQYMVEHTDMSLLKIEKLSSQVDKLQIENTDLQREKKEMEWAGKAMKQLDGVEWKIENLDELTEKQTFIEGPTFYVNNYRLRIYCKYIVGGFGEKILQFYLKRIEGEFDDDLGQACICHYRVIIVNTQNYTKSHYKEGRMNFQLTFKMKSSNIFTASPLSHNSYLIANNSLLLRFYFDINTTEPLTSLTPKKSANSQDYATKVHPTEKKDPFL